MIFLSKNPSKTEIEIYLRQGLLISENHSRIEHHNATGKWWIQFKAWIVEIILSLNDEQRLNLALVLKNYASEVQDIYE